MTDCPGPFSTGTDSPLVRDVHDMAQTLFEDLYLGERSSKLSGVEALALYFDFKEFAPLGRRGDEIVRRLSDRLVELDLLDSAGELLQQVAVGQPLQLVVGAGHAHREVTTFRRV